MRKILLFFSLGIVFAAQVTVHDILAKMDELQTLGEDVIARVEIVQKDSVQGTKLMESMYYTRDVDDLFLIVMTKPESEKGNGYLKVGKNFWMYRRNTRTFQHVNRDESIAGTDTNASDFEASKYSEQYKATLNKNGKEIVEETMLSKVPVYKVNILAKTAEVSYPKKILWVRQDNYLPLKEQSFSLSNTLISSHYFLKYSLVKDKYIALKHLIIDEFEKGNKTLWEIKSLSFEPIEDTIFTKAYLENLSK